MACFAPERPRARERDGSQRLGVSDGTRTRDRDHKRCVGVGCGSVGELRLPARSPLASRWANPSDWGGNLGSCREPAQRGSSARTVSTLARGSSSTAPTASPATAVSATSAPRVGAGRTCSPSFCPGRSHGTGPATTASAKSSAARAPRPRVTTSSSPAGSLRHWQRSGLATPTCRPPAWRGIEPGAFASTPRQARFARRLSRSS